MIPTAKSSAADTVPRRQRQQSRRPPLPETREKMSAITATATAARTTLSPASVTFAIFVKFLFRLKQFWKITSVGRDTFAG